MRTWIPAVSLAIAVATVGDETPTSAAASRPGGHGTLVKYESMETCLVPAEVQRAERRAEEDEANALADEAKASYHRAATPAPPIRRIRDPYPALAAIAVDMARNEVIVTDENLFQVLAYDRTENTPRDAEYSRPKRAISGDRTEIEFQSGVYVDQATGDIYAANNDTRDKTVVFAHGADGNVKPIREVETPHGTFGVTIDEAHQELLLTVQHDSAIVVYRKTASGRESPIRAIQGNRTRLADPHGIAVDPRDDLIFTANYGSTHDVSRDLKPRTGVPSAGNEEGKTNWPLGREWSVPGSGTISGPSIVVHRRSANGNAPPVRVIQGPATQLNWPTGLAFDFGRRELFVANDMGPSVLVFDAEASGNVAPKRVLKGRRTGLANPTGVFVDTKNGELWVTNFGGHSATVYDLAAQGDVAPRRVIRSAPEDAPSLMIGNPGAVAFDSKREELLVPN
jgi:DNA-binding beta-propeller fold protein YncE